MCLFVNVAEDQSVRVRLLSYVLYVADLRGVIVTTETGMRKTGENLHASMLCPYSASLKGQ